jgi:hypothetical protein
MPSASSQRAPQYPQRVKADIRGQESQNTALQRCGCGSPVTVQPRPRQPRMVPTAPGRRSVGPWCRSCKPASRGAAPRHGQVSDRSNHPVSTAVCSRSSRISNGTSTRRRTAGLTLSSVILRRATVAALMPPLYDAPSRRPSSTAEARRACG